MSDNVVYIMGGLIAVLVILVAVSNYMDSISENTNVEIKMLEYVKAPDPVLWPSEEEWEAFYCDLCEYGKAGNINVGNITCPDYPDNKCGCEVSIKLKFETNIKNIPHNMTCNINVNGINVQKIINITEGKKEFSILLGLSSGAKIDTPNVVEVCCYSVCDSENLGEICAFSSNLY